MGDVFFGFTAVGMRFIEAEAGEHARALMNLARVKLVPEPENPHDPNAVQVCDAEDGRVLAHVSRETLAELPAIGAPGRVFAVHQCMKRGNVAVVFTCRIID
jgi:hypothetical protein